MMSSILLNPQLIIYSTALGTSAKIVLGIKRFLLYLIFVMLFSLVTGLLANLVI